MGNKNVHVYNGSPYTVHVTMDTSLESGYLASGEWRKFGHGRDRDLYVDMQVFDAHGCLVRLAKYITWCDISWIITADGVHEQEYGSDLRKMKYGGRFIPWIFYSCRHGSATLMQLHEIHYPQRVQAGPSRPSPCPPVAVDVQVDKERRRLELDRDLKCHIMKGFAEQITQEQVKAKQKKFQTQNIERRTERNERQQIQQRANENYETHWEQSEEDEETKRRREKKRKRDERIRKEKAEMQKAKAEIQKEKQRLRRQKLKREARERRERRIAFVKGIGNGILIGIAGLVYGTAMAVYYTGKGLIWAGKKGVKYTRIATPIVIRGLKRFWAFSKPHLIRGSKAGLRTGKFVAIRTGKGIYFLSKIFATTVVPFLYRMTKAGLKITGQVLFAIGKFMALTVAPILYRITKAGVKISAKALFEIGKFLALTVTPIVYRVLKFGVVKMSKALFLLGKFIALTAVPIIFEKVKAGTIVTSQILMALGRLTKKYFVIGAGKAWMHTKTFSKWITPYLRFLGYLMKTGLISTGRGLLIAAILLGRKTLHSGRRFRQYIELLRKRIRDNIRNRRRQNEEINVSEELVSEQTKYKNEEDNWEDIDNASQDEELVGTEEKRRIAEANVNNERNRRRRIRNRVH